MDEPKDIKINCPEGYEYYLENNTIKFKKIISWDEIKKYMSDSDIKDFDFICNSKFESNNFGKRIEMYTKLLKVATYFNLQAVELNPEEHIQRGSASAVFSHIDCGYHITYDNLRNCFHVEMVLNERYTLNDVYFIRREDAEKAIEFLGRDLIYCVKK